MYLVILNSLIILGFKVLGRPRGIYGAWAANFQLFDSYRSAWHSFSLTQFGNLFLNILIFIPLGITLPILIKSLKRVYNLILLALIFSIAVESIQMLTGAGIFNIDHVFNNIVGMFVGYCMNMAYMSIKNKQSSYRMTHAFICMSPAVIVILVFSSFIGVHSAQEFGNMPFGFYPGGKKSATISILTPLSEEREEKNIYASVDFNSSKEAEKLANSFLSMNGITVDNEANIYDGYYSYNAFNSKSNSTERLHIDKKILTYWYESGNYNSEPNIAFTRSEILERLEKYDIDVPESAIFEILEDGEYRFTCVPSQNELETFGWITVKLDERGNVINLRNSLVRANAVKKVTIISEAEAAKLIAAKDGEIKVDKVTLDYEIDSKGYMQPVYHFSAIDLEGKNVDMVIPALLKKA
jgi:glycopeptide antibiotics resistance protein